jgi:hypothetical protein
MSRDLEPRADQQPISEQDMRRVLERAIEIDAKRAGETTIGELHRIALELNISPASIAEALRELQGKAVVPATPPAIATQTVEVRSGVMDRTFGWIRTSMIALGGHIMARSINTAYGMDDVSAMVFAVSLFAALGALGYRLTHKKPAEYLRDMAALWVGFGFGWLIDPPVLRGEDVVHPFAHLAAVIFGALASSTVGGFLLRFRLPWRSSGSKQSVDATATM